MTEIILRLRRGVGRFVRRVAPVFRRAARTALSAGQQLVIRVRGAHPSSGTARVYRSWDIPLPSDITVGRLTLFKGGDIRRIWTMVRTGQASLVYRTGQGEIHVDEIRSVLLPSGWRFRLLYRGEEVALCKARDMLTLERLEPGE